MSELKALVLELMTQSNAATSHPIYVVQQRRRIYGLDTNYCDHVVWLSMDGDCREADTEESSRLDAEQEETSREPDGWIQTGYRDDWEHVTSCLTRKGAEAYIAACRHRLTDPRVYVESGYCNDEWIGLRALLPAILADIEALA